jgi:predicted N-formylglutamate amidohydrolase
MNNPFLIHEQKRNSRWLVTCDHATNRVPSSVGEGSLGLAHEDMERHIAYDVGAAGVSRHLADELQSTAVLANFSRLVIDPNRGEADPTLLMRLYDGSIIPGNRHADADEKERRLNAFHRPYHNVLAEAAERRNDTVIVSIHSFTPQLNGKPARPWEIGVLHSRDRTFSQPILERLQRENDLTVGDNQPYHGYLPGDAIDRHATSKERPHVLIEIRNDLITQGDQQKAWAERLAPILVEVLNKTQL